MFKQIVGKALAHKPVLCNSNYIFKRLAGHSKWQNIRHTKALNDAHKSKLFGRLSQQMKIAIQEGGSMNPKENQRLDQVISQAKRLSMPVATINNAIKATQTDKTQLKTQTLEIKGPGNCLIICEICSSQIVKIKNDISSIMKKHQCRYTQGESNYIFEQKGIIETELPTQDDPEKIVESATDDAIVSDAEEVKLINDNKNLQFVCDPMNFYNCQKTLESLNYTLTSATVEFIPKILVKLDDSQLELYSTFYDKLDNIPEVAKVTDNIS